MNHRCHRSPLTSSYPERPLLLSPRHTRTRPPGLLSIDADLRPIREPDDHGGPRLDQVLLARAQAPPSGRDQPGPIARRSNAPSPPRDAVDEEYSPADPSVPAVRAADADIRAVASRMKDCLPGARDHPRRSVRGVEVIGRPTVPATDDKRRGGH